MVLGKHPIRTVEGERVALVDSWQMYVPLAAGVPFSLMASWCHSWFGEKHASVRIVYMTDVRDY